MDNRELLLEQFGKDFDKTASPAYKAQCLKLLVRYLPSDGIESITAHQLESFFRNSGAIWSISYLRKVHRAAQVFFHWASLNNLIPLNPMLGMPRAIEFVPNGNETVKTPLLVEYSLHLRSINRAEETVIQRLGDIRRFSGQGNPLSATPQMLGEYLRENKYRWSQEYRRKIRASFVSFYGWALKAGHIAADPTLDLQSIRPGKPPRVPIVEDDLFHAFYSADLIVQAIIALAGSLGMRRTEITVLHTRDRTGRTLTVHGKGDRVRFVPLNDLAFELLVELERRQGGGYYFRNMKTGKHLHPSTVYKHAKAHIGNWCLHSLRHRAATVGLRKGGNIREIQELLGHLSLSTTQIYAGVTFEELANVTTSTSWPREKGEAVSKGSRVTVDLDNLSDFELALIADAISRHLRSGPTAA